MKYLLCLSILLLIISCSEEGTSEIGNDWIENETHVLYIDTLTVKASSLKFDSIIVSGNRVLVGAYNDPVFGLTISETFAQLNIPDSEIENEAIYDSIALILNYDTYYYNDTISQQKLNIYEVIDDIKPKEDYYYNTTKFNFNTTPLGTKTFSPRPLSKDSLHISLDTAFGNELFSKIKNNDINNIDEFLNEYKGILIQPDTILNTAIIGFSKESTLRIYYTIKDDGGNIEGIWNFPFNSSNCFNHMYSNTSGTDLNSLTNQGIILPSTETSNNTFIQSGIGIISRVDIPYIKSLYNISGTGSILDANLKISLNKNQGSQFLHTKDTLSMYIIDNNSQVVADLLNSSGQIAYGTIIEENSEFNSTTYSIPVKTFLDIKLSEDVNNDDLFLAIYSQEFNNSLDRYIFYGENNSALNRINLELTYAIYNDN